MGLDSFSQCLDLKHGPLPFIGHVSILLCLSKGIWVDRSTIWWNLEETLKLFPSLTHTVSIFLSMLSLPVNSASVGICPLILGVGPHCVSPLLMFSGLLGPPASSPQGSFCVPLVSTAAFLPSDSLGPFCAPLEHRGTCGCSRLALWALGKPRWSCEAIVCEGPGQALWEDGT